jgi:hypothetical protein
MATKFPVSPYLREFLYSALYAITPDQKFSLKGKYAPLAKTNYYAKRFCDRASVDEIQHILTLLGYEWFMVFFYNAEKRRQVSEVVEMAQEDGSKNSSLKRAIQRRVYVTNQKKFVQHLGLLSAQMEGNEYLQEMQLSKAGYHVRKWSKSLNFENTEKAKYNSITIDLLCSTFVNSILVFNASVIHKDDIIILFYLYPKKDHYVHFDIIQQYLQGIMSKNKLSSSIRRLSASSMIEKKLSEKKFRINGLGMLEVHKMMDALLKLNSIGSL